MEAVSRGGGGRMSINRYQKLLLKAYPAAELLGLDLEDPKAITDAVHSPEGTGDLLSSFLWIELEGCKEDAEALRRIDTAMSELKAIRRAIIAGSRDVDQAPGLPR